MIIKRLFFLLILFTFGINMHLFAQPDKQNVEKYLNAAGDYASLYRGKFVNQSSVGWKSHPYWGDGQFVDGTISFYGVVYPHVKLRYNLYEQILEVQSPDRQLAILPDQKHIDYFEFEGMHFEPRDYGFACIDYAAQDFTLETFYFKKRTKDDLETRYALKVLALDSEIMIRSKDGVKEVTNLSSIKKLFPAYKAELQQLKKEKHLKFKSSLRNGSMVECVKCVAEKARQNQVDALPTIKKKKSESKGIGDKEVVQSQAPVSVLYVQLPDSLIIQPDSQLSLTDLAAYEAFKEGAPYVVKKAAERALANSGGIKELTPDQQERILNEVEITAFRSNVGLVQMGAEKFRPQQLRNVPMAMGEADVMKMVQAMPGVKTMGEASSGFNVRGGASDQNLILLSGGTIYNPMHLFGLFSAFNTDALNDVELFKGSIPSQFGGRIASVMNVTAKQADKKDWHGSVSLGLLTSKACLELPLIKNKLSLLLAGRATYSDWLLKKLPEESEYCGGKAGFYDMNGTLSWTINKNHYLNIYGYFSHDRFGFSDYDKYGYTNGNGSAEWKGYWSDQFSSVVTAGYDHYDYTNDETAVETTASQLSFQIEQKYLRAHFEYKTGDNNTLKFGLNNLMYNLMPGKYMPVGNFSTVKLSELTSQTALEETLYLEDEFSASKHWKLLGGFRATMFANTVQDKSKAYLSPEARLSVAYSPNENNTLKAGVNTMSQFVHKVSNTIIMSPTDTWILSNKNIKPQQGWQGSLGYAARTNNGVMEFSAEVYYKEMQNYLTYRGGAVLLMNPNLEDDVVEARGKAYGAEVQIKKLTGKLNGWISYCYSKTMLQQQDLTAKSLVNDGAWYPAEYDRPHELNVVANYKFTRRYSMSLNVDYATGRPTTVPAGKYYNSKTDCYIPFYTDRNGYRLPDNFRVDLSFNIEPTHRLTAKTHTWVSFGVYNLLGRKNIYNVYYEVEGKAIKGKALSIFGCQIPFISFNVKF